MQGVGCTVYHAGCKMQGVGLILDVPAMGRRDARVGERRAFVGAKNGEQSSTCLIKFN